MPAFPSFNESGLRVILTINQVFLWMSAVIVMGITSYFINKYGNSGEHIIYQEVISCMSVAFYIPAIFLPLLKWYKGQLLGLSVVFSYLWLTAFIFNAQDYDWHACQLGDPAGGDCSKKHANEAFTFLAFFFSFTAILLEAWIIKGLTGTAPAATNGHTDKEYGTNGTNGATPAATV